MPNRQYYILKFNSSWLREFDFNIHITFEQALKNKKVIALADNQMLRTIREITNHNVDMNKIEFLFQQREKIKIMDNNIENMSKIKYLQKIKTRTSDVRPYDGKNVGVKSRILLQSPDGASSLPDGAKEVEKFED